MFNYEVVQNLWHWIRSEKKSKVVVVSFENSEEISESEEVTEVFADYWEDTEAVFACVKEANNVR